MEDVQQYASIIHNIANDIHKKSPDVEYGELVSAGYVGALKAIRSYDQSKGTTLKSYIGRHVRWEMLNEMRRLDHVSVHLRRIIKLLHNYEDAYFIAHGTYPNEEQITKATGLSLCQINRCRQATSNDSADILETQDDLSEEDEEENTALIKKLSEYLTEEESDVMQSLLKGSEPKKYSKTFIENTKDKIGNLLKSKKFEKSTR